MGLLAALWLEDQTSKRLRELQSPIPRVLETGGGGLTPYLSALLSSPILPFLSNPTFKLFHLDKALQLLVAFMQSFGIFLNKQFLLGLAEASSMCYHHPLLLRELFKKEPAMFPHLPRRRRGK